MIRTAFSVFILYLLSVLTERNGPISTNKILRSLKHPEKILRMSSRYMVPYLDLPMYEKYVTNVLKDPQLLNSMLDGFEKLGLVARLGNSSEEGENPLWRLSEFWEPPEPPSDDSGGGSDQPPQANNNSDDDGGGGGIREVLGHPILLALSPEDFDDLVNDLFQEEQP